MNTKQTLQQPDASAHADILSAGIHATVVSFPRGKRLQANSLGPSSEKEDMAPLVVLIAENRDRDAFMQLYKYFAPRVKSFLKGKGLSDSSADDVLQVVMLSVWEKAHMYDQAKAAVSTWIFTIARYKYIDLLRRQGRQATKASSQDDEPDLRPSGDMVADDEVMQQQRQDAVTAAIANLPAEQQSVIFLSFIKGLAHSEIAERLGLPLGTVKSRIRRAFSSLREDLGEVT
jgi:RNA polymerase sigma-70 factor (ECF subfamily)